MSDVSIEAFLSNPENSADAALSKLLGEIREEFGDRVEIVIHEGDDSLFEDYNITSTPALVIGDLIKIMGFCPSKETLVSALGEAGLS
jgi:hypothetical protein